MDLTQDARLRELQRLAGSPPRAHPILDEICEFAAASLGLPITLVSIVDGDVLWYKGRTGLDIERAALPVTFCGRTIKQGKFLAVLDASRDERFRDNVFVTRPPFVRFYAGVPLHLSGEIVGTLCAMSPEPRPAGLNEKERDTLARFARLVERFVDSQLESHALESAYEQLRIFDRVLADTSEAVMVTEASGLDEPEPRICYVNPAFTRMSGYTAQEAVNRSPRFLQGPKTARTELDRLRQALEEGRPAQAEVINYRKDGSEYWVELDVAPVSGESGQITHFVSVQRDVTARHTMRKQLEDLAKRLNTVLESTTDGVFLLDREWRIRYMNGRAQRAARCGDVTGMVFWDVFPVEQARDFFNCYQEAIAAGESRSVEAYYEPLQGWFEAHAHPGDEGLAIFFRDVTERRRRDEELRETTGQLARADAKVRRMFQYSQDMICSLDGEGYFTDVSPACRRILGYRPDEMTGRHFAEFIHPDDVEASHDAARSVIAGHPTVGFLNRYRTKAGGYVHLLWSSYWSEQEKSFFSVARDATERTRAENELRKSEANLAKAQKIARLGNWTLDLDAKTVECSAYTYELFGLDPEPAARRREWFDKCIHPEDWAEVQSTVAQAAKEQRPFEIEHRIVRPDGAVRTVHLIGEYSAGPGGHKALFGTIQDITERREAETALRESEERYRLLFHLSPLPMFIYDEETLRILGVNLSAAELYGYSEEELLGMTAVDLMSPEEAENFERQRREDPGVERRAGLWGHRRKDGALVWVEGRSHSIRFEGRPAQLLLTADVTEKMALEEQLRQAMKMDAIGKVAGGIAHDFNNLLTVINGYTALLRERFSEDPELQRDLTQILGAGERAASLTRQLLAFSRKQILQPRVLSLNAVIEGLDPILRRLIPENIEVVTALDAEAGHVLADRNQLEQVILNLAINARDAMPRGGRLTLQTGRADLDEAYVSKNLDAQPGRYAMLMISDNGQGMSAEVRSRIFDPFFTTKPFGSGTGLGLSTAYGIIKQSGGHISVYSELGMGSCFKIYLPQIEEAGAASEAASKGRRVMATKGTECILVVEDDENVREFVVSVLKSHAYEVIEAASGTDAIAEAEKAKAEGGIDLLLTDVVMPRMNGRELAARLTRKFPKLKVLFVSGYTEDAIVHHGVLEPGLTYLPKPFTPEALAEKVRETLDAPQRKRSVLIADDDDEVRRLFSKVLTREGYEVLEAVDGKDALRLARKHGADLLLTDLVMPEQEGVETIQIFRQEFPHTRVIAISGAAAGGYLKMAKLLGAEAVLEKPIEPQALVAKIREMIG